MRFSEISGLYEKNPHYIDLSFRIHREHPTPACPEILDHQRSHPCQARGGFRPAPRSWQKRGTPRHTRTHQGRKHEGKRCQLVRNKQMYSFLKSHLPGLVTKLIFYYYLFPFCTKSLICPPDPSSGRYFSLPFLSATPLSPSMTLEGLLS